MASAFWFLEDGRGFTRRWRYMAYMLELITDELKGIKGAEEFYVFMEELVYREEKGDVENGFGGFIRGEECIMFNFDLRSFAPKNREYFWLSAQKALKKLIITRDNKHEGIIFLLTELMDMHKRIKKGEYPMKLNHMTLIESEPNEKIGPGW